MERYTASTYNKAIKLAEASIRGQFNVVNTREIDLSSSGITDEKLIEITVDPMKNSTPIVKSPDNYNSMPEVVKLIREELAPLHNMKLELGLLREEVDILSRRVQNLLSPDLDEELKGIFNYLTELGVEKMLCERLLRGFQFNLEQPSTNKIDAFKSSFDQIVSTIPENDNLKHGDVLILFGPSASGKSTIAEILENRFNQSLNVKLLTGHSPKDVKDINENDLTIFDFTSIQVNESNSMQKLMRLSQSVNNPKKIMVLPSTTGLEDMLHLYACYKPMEPDGLIFSRMEETTQTGKLLTAILEINLPLFGITYCENGIINFKENGMKLIFEILSINLDLNDES